MSGSERKGGDRSIAVIRELSRRGDGLKHAHRAGKRAPLAKKSGRRPSSSSPRIRSSRERASRRVRSLVRQPFSRQTEPFSFEKITGRTRRRVLSIAATSRKRARTLHRINPGDGRELVDRLISWTWKRLCCTFASLVDAVVLDVQSLRNSSLMSTRWSLFHRAPVVSIVTGPAYEDSP